MTVVEVRLACIHKYKRLAMSPDDLTVCSKCYRVWRQRVVHNPDKITGAGLYLHMNEVTVDDPEAGDLVQTLSSEFGRSIVGQLFT